MIENVPCTVLASSILYCTVLATGLSSCRSLSSEITPSAESSSTLMVPWEADFDDHLLTDQPTCGLPDGRLLVLSKDYYDYTLQGWSRLLTKDFESALNLQRSERHLILYSVQNRAILLSQIEEDDDLQVLLIRDINTTNGDVSEPKEILRTDPEFDRRLLFRHSPDSSWILMYGLGESFQVKSARTSTSRALYTVVLNTKNGDVTTTRDTLLYDDPDESRTYRDVAISNDGVIGIAEAIPVDEGRYQMIVHSIDESGRRMRAHHFPNRLDSLDPAHIQPEFGVPTSIRVTFLPDGSLFVASDLQTSNRATLTSTVRISSSLDRVVFNVPVRFDSAMIQQISHGELHHLRSSYYVADAITHTNGSITLIHESRRVSYHSASTGRRSYGYEIRYHDPLIVTHIESADTPSYSFFIPRNETWKPDDLAFYEGGQTWFLSGDSLFIALRRRDMNGVALYLVDPASRSVDSTVVVGLGNRAYFVPRKTVWHSEQDITFFVKAGEMGNDWQILRVSP